MANFIQTGDNYKISIPYWKSIDKNTFYVIKIDIGDVSWTVTRRYSEFAKLHQTLVADHGVFGDILPPKKVIGNKDEQFIEKRRLALDQYLSNIVRFLQKTMPKDLALFLNFYQFDISYIVKTLAVKFYPFGEISLSKTKSYKLSTIEVGLKNPIVNLCKILSFYFQLYAINERLKQPCTNSDLRDKKEDFSHVLDFCYQMTELNLIGSDEPLAASNIVPNKLPLKFSFFKKLETLNLQDVNCANMTDMGSLRTTLKHLSVNRCQIKNLAELLLCDQIHKTEFENHNQWKALINLAISSTHIINIDQSIRLVPNLKVLVLDSNQISAICGLNILPQLENLSLRMNRILQLDVIESQKLVFLDLSENFLSSLSPFSDLISLETLNLQMNKISNILEIKHIASLPCLENLVLTGNPVSQIIDYRVKVLENFSRKAYRICLDNESPTQKELDKVAILAALHKSEKGLVLTEAIP